MIQITHSIIRHVGNVAHIWNVIGCYHFQNAIADKQTYFVRYAS